MRGFTEDLSLQTSARVYHSGVFVASEGRIRLLELIDEMGSLQAAADSMRMSYRHAWGMVKRMEETMGVDLVDSSRGGTGGGKSFLSEDGRCLVSFFRSRETALNRLSKYGPAPVLAVDVVVLRRNEVHENDVLLVKRGKPPFLGLLALPGGFLEYGETTEEAAVREVHEETGQDVVVRELAGVFSQGNRDPRGHVVSVVYTAILKAGKEGGKLRGGDDASEALWVPVKDARGLAFDHDALLDTVLSKCHRKLK